MKLKWIREAQVQRKSALWGALIPVIGVERWFGGVTTDTPQAARRTWFYAEWRLLDNLGQSTRSRMDQAASQERQARLRQNALREQIAGEVLAAQQAVAAAKEQVRVAQQQVTAAEGSLTVFRERYANGLGCSSTCWRRSSADGSPAEPGDRRGAVQPGAGGAAEPIGRGCDTGAVNR